VTDSAADATFPVLTADQVDRLRRYGSVRSFSAGEVLFSPHDDSYEMLVVLTGEIVINDESQGRQVEFARHRPGQFAGELSLMTGQRPYLTGRATQAGSALALPPARVREVLARETDIADILLRAMIARRRQLVASAAAIEVIGSGTASASLALRTFLSRNAVAYQWLDIDIAPDASSVLAAAGAVPSDLPLVITPTRVLANADPAAVAQLLGLGNRPDGGRCHDVLVVGAGPAGLAAAVYGASEGLDVTVLDATAPGGQAGSSSRIENYLGFPDGISGAELTARASIQAQRFGAQLASPCQIASMTRSGDHFEVTLADGTRITGLTVVAASGALYRRLPLANWERLEGAGIFYAATELEAGLCSAGPVFVLGGGNSAGQAALYLSRTCPQVTIVIRRESLAASMSEYLIDRIEASDRISVAALTEITGVDGDGHLEQIWLHDKATGQVTQAASRGLFCFIGAHPASDWLPEQVTRDEDGFVLTDVAIRPSRPGQPASRPRLPYETAVDGLFAAGDIRVGSMKRVAAAVGEGSSVIRSIHQYLAAFSDRDRSHDPGQRQPAPVHP
jgi:thioredoxin reductase (NADPH)